MCDILQKRREEKVRESSKRATKILAGIVDRVDKKGYALLRDGESKEVNSSLKTVVDFLEEGVVWGGKFVIKTPKEREEE